MSNPVCVIYYFDDNDSKGQFYGLTDCANTAAKMLLDDGVIDGSTEIAYRQENGEVVLRELDSFSRKDRVEVVARGLSGKNNKIKGIVGWSMSTNVVYDKDDYAGEDEDYLW